MVDNRKAAISQIRALMNTTFSSHQIYLILGGVFVESFLAGREFTVLCTGSEDYGVTGIQSF